MINIICVGNLKEKYWSNACEEYLKRISKYSKIQIIELKESKLEPYQLVLKEEAKNINKILKGYVIKLAIEGEIMSSEKFSEKIEKEIINNTDISFVIGSSHGLDSSLNYNFSLSFSKMTFPHQLSRVLLLEQIYRAFTILHNTKYHK